MMKHLRSERGQSLIESALVFTLLLVLALGVINFAFIFYVHVGVVNAAAVAATYAATSPATANNVSGITATALEESPNWRCSGGQPTVIRTLGTDQNGNSKVTVTVSCDVDGLIELPFGLDQVTVSGQAVRRVKPLSP